MIFIVVLRIYRVETHGTIDNKTVEIRTEGFEPTIHGEPKFLAPFQSGHRFYFYTVNF